MVTPPSRLGRVLTALVRTHPYEEPAYDIYPVQSFLEEAHAIWTGSLGRPVRADSLARRVRKLLECSSVRLAGDPACQVKQVAICAGGGKSLLKKAASLKADLFITGDIDYHSARLAESLGLTVLDAGHFPTEKFFPELCSTALGRLPGLKDLRYVPLPVEKDPFQAF
jgi:putative NIF3 family GTP cyclohydrolase 1 type 2